MRNIWCSWNFVNIDPRVESLRSKKKIKSYIQSQFSSQIIPRDEPAHYFSVLGIIAGSVRESCN